MSRLVSRRVLSFFGTTPTTSSSSYSTTTSSLNIDCLEEEVIEEDEVRIRESGHLSDLKRTGLAVFLVLLLLAQMEGVSGIGCFVCSSFDGENRGCEDPFNSTMDLSSRDRDASAVANYNYPCWAYKKGRHGLFPADHCIKIIGFRADNESKTLVIRTCALDSGTLTADTEIVRISHCGSFKYEGHQYKGCVQSCDTDGCNSTTSLHQFSAILPVFLIFFMIFKTIFR